MAILEASQSPHKMIQKLGNYYNAMQRLYPYFDERRDIRSNIPLRLKEFPRSKPKGPPEGKGVYLTVYPESSPNTDSISF